MKQSIHRSSRRAFVVWQRRRRTHHETGLTLMLMGRDNVQGILPGPCQCLLPERRIPDCCHRRRRWMGSGRYKQPRKFPACVCAACDLHTGRPEAPVTAGVSGTHSPPSGLAVTSTAPTSTPSSSARPITGNAQISFRRPERRAKRSARKPMVHDVSGRAGRYSGATKSGKPIRSAAGAASGANEKRRNFFESGAIGQLIYAEGFCAQFPYRIWQYAIPPG